MTIYEWLLVGLLALIILLVCAAAAVYYGPRPQYPNTMSVYSTPVKQHEARHSTSGQNGMTTQRLPGRQSIYPEADQ